jgi:hypothetical protein
MFSLRPRLAKATEVLAESMSCRKLHMRLSLMHQHGGGRKLFSKKGEFIRGQAANSDKTVVAFIIMPASVNNYNVEALKGQAVTKSLRETVKDVQSKIGKRIFEAALKYDMVLCIVAH